MKEGDGIGCILMIEFGEQDSPAFDEVMDFFCVMATVKKRFLYPRPHCSERIYCISGSFIIPKTINYYSFLAAIVPKIGYTIGGREVQSLCI